MENGMNHYFPGAFSCFVAETGSTMDEARKLSASYPLGLVHAGIQSAGRGRLPDRRWHAEAGHSLLATFWFPSGEFAGAPLPHIAGLALAAALESWAKRSGTVFAHRIELKWPNDLLCRDRKLAGILCESAGGYIFAGMGVNCAQTVFPPGFRTEPTSALLETGLALEPASLIPGIARALSDLKESGPAWKGFYEARLAWRGRSVFFRPGLEQTPIQGTLVGVDDAGALVLDTAEGTRVFASGELSVAY
jgi:BirA family transcriptional regulator, biotin operon repressor / biotin---[acetyl-CoA-carboxylase] ligase